MKLRMVMVSLLAVGLMAAGCKKGDEGDKKDEKSQEQAESEPSKDDESKGEESGDGAEDDEQEDEEAAAEGLDEEAFVTVTYELTCVDQELSGEVDSEEIRTKILGKHGVDAEAYEKAESKYEGNEEVAGKLDERLKDCDAKTARKLAGLSEGDGEADSEGEESAKKDEPKRAPRPPMVGTVTGTTSNTAGFSTAKLSVTVTEGWKANGRLEGKREKGFRIPLSGTVSKSNNMVTLQGKEGKNSAKVTGKLKSDGVVADVKGEVFGNPFSITINAEK